VTEHCSTTWLNQQCTLSRGHDSACDFGDEWPRIVERLEESQRMAKAAYDRGYSDGQRNCGHHPKTEPGGASDA
jgi:hypothetical protein